MVVEPLNSSSAEHSDYEKDRLAWNLPQPKAVSPSAWRRLELVPEPDGGEPGPGASTEPS